MAGLFSFLSTAIYYYPFEITSLYVMFWHYWLLEAFFLILSKKGSWDLMSVLWRTFFTSQKRHTWNGSIVLWVDTGQILSLPQELSLNLWDSNSRPENHLVEFRGKIINRSAASLVCATSPLFYWVADAAVKVQLGFHGPRSPPPPTIESIKERLKPERRQQRRRGIIFHHHHYYTGNWDVETLFIITGMIFFRPMVQSRPIRAPIMRLANRETDFYIF